MSEETCLLDNHSSSFASFKDFHKEAAPPKKRGKVFGKGFLYKKKWTRKEKCSSCFVAAPRRGREGRLRRGRGGFSSGFFLVRESGPLLIQLFRLADINIQKREADFRRFC